MPYVLTVYLYVPAQPCTPENHVTLNYAFLSDMEQNLDALSYIYFINL